MQNNKRYLLISLCLLCVGLALFFFARFYHITSTQQQVKHIIVRLNWLNQAQYAGMYVAKEKGFYKQAGLDVDLKEYQDGVDQAEEVADGKADFAISTPVELLTSVNEGKQVKAVAVIYQTSPEAFVALTSSHITSPAQWWGKVLGSKGGNKIAQVLYPWLLTKFNISTKNVTLKDLDYSMDEAGDLVNHRADVVDVFRTDQTRTLEQKGIAFNLITPETYGITQYGDTIIVANTTISTNPDLVQKFVSATQEGWNYAVSHRDEAIDMTMKYANNQYKERDQEAYIMDKSIPLINQPSQGPIGSMNFRIWNAIGQEMKDVGLLNVNFDVTSVYTTKFISQ